MEQKWSKYEEMIRQGTDLSRRIELCRRSGDKDTLLELVRVNERILSWVKEHKLLMFYPGEGDRGRSRYGKHLEHYKAGSTHRERCLMGGNRTGKTICGAYETTLHLTGWYPDWWEGRRFSERIDAVAAGKTNETAREIVQKELLGDIRTGLKDRNFIVGTGMIPKECLVDKSETYKKGVSKLIDYVDVWYKDSKHEHSRLYIKSYEQKRQAFEGTARHSVWLDEEPPFDIYNEALMRTMTVGGLMFLTFTPLDGLTETVMQFLPKDERPEIDLDEMDEVSV